MQRLLDLGFVMVSSWLGRGTIPDDHPFNLSGLNGNGMPMIQDFYKTVDLALVVGSHMMGHESGDGAVKPPAEHHPHRCRPAAPTAGTIRTSYFVCGDAKLTLQGLLEARSTASCRFEPGFQDEFRALKTKALKDYLAQFGPYTTFMEQLRAVMPKDAIWARDITQSTSTWGNRIFPIYSPRENVYPVSAGIGQGLPLSIGAAAAAGGRKTVLLTGDGGFYLNLGELWTAVQEKARHRHHRDERQGLRRDQETAGPDCRAAASFLPTCSGRTSRDSPADLRHAVLQGRSL